jgi:phosphate transport system substrate-binding protein
MTTPANPYIIDTPVTGDEFFGREALIESITNVLRYPAHTSIIVYGQRRIGKTSLLKQLAGKMKAPFFPVYFNLDGKATEPLTEVLHQMAGAAAAEAGMPAPPAELFKDGPDAFHQKFLPELYKAVGSQQQPTFLLDEFNPVDTPEKELSPEAAGRQLDSYLYKLLTTQNHTDFIFAAGRRMNELSSVERSGYQADLNQYLTVLNPEQARKLINKPGAPPYEEEAIIRILDVTRGHPYLLQLLCHTIYEQSSATNRPVTEAEVESAATALLASKHSGLALIWESIPIAEQITIAAAAERLSTPGASVSQAVLENAYLQAGVSPTSGGLRQAPRNLVNWQVFEQSPGGYSFFVDYFRRWVSHNHSLAKTKAAAMALDPKVNLLFIEAQRAYNNGQPDTAMKMAEQVLQLNPDHLRAHMLIGQIHADQKRPEQAVQAYESAFRLNRAAATGGWVAAMLMLAKQQTDRNDTDRARATYKRLLAIDPGNDEAEAELMALNGNKPSPANTNEPPLADTPPITVTDPGETIPVTPPPSRTEARQQARSHRQRQQLMAAAALLLLLLLCAALFFLRSGPLFSRLNNGLAGNSQENGNIGETGDAAAAWTVGEGATAETATATAGIRTTEQARAEATAAAATAAVENATALAVAATATVEAGESATAEAITNKSARVQAATAAAANADTATTEAENQATADATAGVALAGEVNIAGAATMLPAIESLVTEFTTNNPDVTININAGSSQDGLSALQQGNTSVALVTRPVSIEELETLGEVQLFALPQADPVAIVIHPQLPVDGLSSQQLRDIFSGKITNWQAVGGPDAPIVLVLPPATADTRTTFETSLLDEDAGLMTEGVITAGSDAAVGKIVAREANAIGFTAAIRQATTSNLSQSRLQEQNWAVIDTSLLAAKTVLLDDTAPSNTAAADGSYPLSRPFNIVAAKDLPPAVQAWIDFLLSPEGQSLIEQNRQEAP